MPDLDDTEDTVHKVPCFNHINPARCRAAALVAVQQAGLDG
jgi:hypothetical protein